MTSEEDQFINLKDKHQLELLDILDWGWSRYECPEMVKALEKAPGIDDLTESEREYRESHLKFLREAVAEHYIGLFIDAHGIGPFTMSNIATWAMQELERQYAGKLDQVDLDDVIAQIRTDYQPLLDLLVGKQLIKLVGKGVYQIVLT